MAPYEKGFHTVLSVLIANVMLLIGRLSDSISFLFASILILSESIFPLSADIINPCATRKEIVAVEKVWAISIHFFDQINDSVV